MKNNCVLFLVTGLALLVSSAAASQSTTTDGDSVTQTPGEPGAGHPLVKFILAHEKALQLTSDQVAALTKLEEAPANPHAAHAKTASAGLNNQPAHPHHELPPKITAILTAEQQTELLALLAERHHHHGKHGAAGNQAAGATTGSATK